MPEECTERMGFIAPKPGTCTMGHSLLLEISSFPRVLRTKVFIELERLERELALAIRHTWMELTSM